ncbi:hypothetical protein DMB65_21255 [Flavobacterium cheongpyeongense]|uniref:Uncharacterized protein n=1 Tax=Flavobacterium cheongpyeongense TaxID=2212651 RepID=A0A2V4BXM6_9FLAO|nr:hypothetical protein [Flavobacterium cheongpyeongense]PXY38744.1 hypothetical protein DMB65_21255 [Flavobacterium cheongpyeongense]
MKKNNKATFSWIFMVLFYLGYTYFIFAKPNIIESKDLIEIKAELAELPIYYESTADNVPSLDFKIVGTPTNFTIKSCGLQNLNLSQFENMKFRDSISFLTNKESTLYEKIINEKEAFSFVFRENNSELLKLSDYNICEKSVWKEFFLLTLLMITALIFSIVRKDENTNDE